ncbi:TIGR01841 family phasin [Hyphomonadaceae bacterium BL14]|nr:TIGR01841 family phasin [Hyphomonadaceae bacterium BL14]
MTSDTESPTIDPATGGDAAAPGVDVRAPAAVQSSRPANTRSAKTGKAVREPSPPRKMTGATTMAAAKKDPAKEAFETVTAASNDAIKDGFEKSVNALNEFTAFQKDTVDAMIASATTAAKSIEEINTAAVAYAKKSMEDSAAAAKTMASAKSVQELIEVQADYTKSAMEAYLAEVTRQSELMSGLVKQSFKPLNDRAAAAVELMQSQR